jgi:thiamine-phosphate diphosphorylase
MQAANMALGISTHSYGELSAALGVKPSYISLGPVFATSSKNVDFDPQGLSTVRKWRQLISPDVPLVAIGGIGDAYTATQVKEAGADCAAVIGAVTKAKETRVAVSQLNEAMI